MLNKTQCLCGCELKGKKFNKYIPMKLDDRFYGGRVSMTGDIICECGRELKGYFTKPANEIELIDLEVVKDITGEEKNENMPTSGEENRDEMTQKEKKTKTKTKSK